MFMKNLWLSKIEINKIQKEKVFSIIVFAFCFGIVKINSISSIFISSNFSPSTEIFGILDYALAVGLIVSIPVMIGLPGAYPYFIIKKNKIEYEYFFFFHGLFIGITTVVFYFLIQIFDLGISIYIQFVALVTVVFSLQIIASVIYKSKNKIYKSLIFESGFFLLLNGYNLYLFINKEELNIQILIHVYLCYIIGLIIYYGYKISIINKIEIKKYKEIIKFGMYLVIGSFLIMALTTSSRIFIKELLGMKYVGIYGIYFRIAALIVILYQIINIVFFKKIYTASSEKLDDVFFVFLFLITLISLLFIPLVPYVFIPFVELINDTWESNSNLYILLSFQMIYWIGLALFENVIHRENLSKKCNKGLFVFVILLLVIILFLSMINLINLFSITLVNTIIIYGACEWKIYLLREKSLMFYKTRKLLRIIFMGLLFYSFI